MGIKIIDKETFLLKVDVFAKQLTQEIVDTWDNKEKMYLRFRDIVELTNTPHITAISLLVGTQNKNELSIKLQKHLISSFGEEFLIPNPHNNNYTLVSSEQLVSVMLSNLQGV